MHVNRLRFAKKPMRKQLLTAEERELVQLSSTKP
jgi:hypothetical protein